MLSSSSESSESLDASSPAGSGRVNVLSQVNPADMERRGPEESVVTCKRNQGIIYAVHHVHDTNDT